MEYQEFICAIEKKMNRKLEGGVTASLYTAVKNNGKVKKGMLVEAPGVNISPTIYLEEFYERFSKGESMDEIVEDILKFYHTIRCDKSWNTSRIEHYDSIRDKIVFKLINTEKNQELLKSIPHMELLDLSIVFYALLDINQQGTATMTVGSQHLQSWDVTKEELFSMACENAKRLLPAQLFTMQQAVDEILHCASGERKNLLEGIQKPDGDFMYVLSNPIRSLGAACIAYPEVLDMAGRILGDDYYVLPSSVHEVVLVPESKGMAPDEMDAMVAEINETHVEEEELLSNHAYIYERKARRLTMRKYVNC
ncbi:MAG: hypothetical protein HFH15_09080 [Ruminococcus sp.]|nr:hypothetical protein [Ruminococcus sp.]